MRTNTYNIDLLRKRLSDKFLLFADIPMNELEELVNAFSLEEYKKRSVIIAPNNTTNIKVHYMVKGLVRCFYHVVDKEITLDFKEEETLFVNGYTLFTRRPNIDYYVAIEDTVCLSADYNTLEMLSNKYHSIEHLNRKIVEAYYASYLITNFNNLFLSAEEKYAVFMREKEHLLHRLPLKYIASYLGIKQETLSRLRAKRINAL